MPPTMRSIALTALASAWILIVVSPSHRSAIARLVAKARRFPRRLVDRDARASARAEETWEGEVGAPRRANREPDAVAGR
jgi:hypothetical protein